MTALDHQDRGHAHRDLDTIRDRDQGLVRHPSDRADAIGHGLGRVKPEPASLTDLDNPNFQGIASGPPLVRIGSNRKGMCARREHFPERLHFLRFHCRVQPQQKRAQFFARNDLGHGAS